MMDPENPERKPPSEAEEKRQHVENIAGPDKEKFKNTVIFLSNSMLDGFREGDGDLMDKLTFHLNEAGIEAVRIVEKMSKVPADKQSLLGKQQIITLDDEADPEGALITRMESRPYKDKHKILYIGSRFDRLETRKGLVSLTGSGSLYSSSLIKRLKNLNIKIVICCLEYKFFRRSLSSLPQALQMLRQQLFLADRIHFLTEHDKSNFEKTLSDLSKSPSGILTPHKKINTPGLFGPEKSFEFSMTETVKEFGGAERLVDHQKKCVFVSGIHTIKPLDDEEVLSVGKPLSPIGKDNLVIRSLLERPNNILCLGIIRPHKGVEEAISLADCFQKKGKNNHVFIVGRIMIAGLFFVQKIMMKVFNISRKEFNLAMYSALEDMVHKGEVTLKKGTNVKKLDYAQYPKDIFNEDKELLNVFFTRVYEELPKKHPPHLKNVHFYFNVTEQKVKDIAKQCRYAIKLDHKGMANNASTIASCLGMYLPTFTMVGLVTDNPFKDSRLGHYPNKAGITLYGEYCKTVIMPQKSYAVIGEEVQPEKPLVEWVHEIMEESEEAYGERLLQLRKLYKDKVFDVQTVTLKLLKQLFIPLNEEFYYEKQSPLAEGNKENIPLVVSC